MKLQPLPEPLPLKPFPKPEAPQAPSGKENLIPLKPFPTPPTAPGKPITDCFPERKLPKGEATPHVPLHEDTPPLKVDQHKDGSLTLHFPRGHYPETQTALQAAFPDARQIETVKSDHQHPFSVDYVRVDGKPYTVSVLTGGFVAASALQIYPGHQHPSQRMLGERSPDK
ncbi:MAG: hypothetical protein ACO1RX_14025 [Candidatus Sericytochromatia bacterium]